MGSTLSIQTRRELLLQMVPRYRKANTSQKGALLDEIAATTGYARRYAMWLLNHPQEIQQPPLRQRQRTFGPEVQQALFLAWQAANQICSKRLMPFLPTLIESLERHGHLHLTDACRSQLLSMSVATADRLLRAHRERGSHGIATTRAGTLLKQQIPVRTFQQWNETRPGFLEADLVAHCGSQIEGSFLSTLTLTDIATGWTECFPLLSKSAEAVVSALEQARACFPFPILGLDTDNGGEFINESLLAYCDAEQITFTRGREGLKNDQCFVEQKNRVVVRQVVGYGRFEGEHAARQLAELYRALRFYVNCFQPSMKLQAKHYEGRKVRRVYDAAKTPLQRLLLSGVLPTSTQEELNAMVKALDPIRLFHHLQQLQQAVFRCAVNDFPVSQKTPDVSLLRFALEGCTTGAIPSKGMEQDEETVLENSCQESGESEPVLDWQRTCKDPLVIHGCPITAPEPHQGEPAAESHVCLCSPVPVQPVDSSSAKTSDQSVQSRPMGEEPREATRVAVQATTSARKQNQAAHPLPVSLSPVASLPTSLSVGVTIEQAIESYLQEHRRAKHSPKTLEWHQTALSYFQQYLLAERHLLRVSQITETDIHGWFAFLGQTPTSAGKMRSAHTIETYARSLRAFCNWLVHRGEIARTPLNEHSFPWAEASLPHFLQPEAFEQLVLICQPTEAKGLKAERVAARDRAILWVLFDTGITVSELCTLRLGDVDRQTGILSVKRKGGKERQIALQPKSLERLLWYVDQSRPVHLAEGGVSKDHLFLSRSQNPLTKNSLVLLFGRLRKRAGISGPPISPQILRHGFALRYLLAGGDPCGLRELLGYKGMGRIKLYLRWYNQLLDHRAQCMGESLN